MGRKPTLLVLVVAALIGQGLALAQQPMPTAAQALDQVIDKYKALQTLEAEGDLVVTKSALGFNQTVRATYSLLFRRPMDVLYKLKWLASEKQERAQPDTEATDLQHTLQCFGGAVRDYYTVCQFDDGSRGEAVVISDLPETLKGLDMSPVLEQVLLDGVDKQAVGEVFYTGVADERAFEIAFDLALPPPTEDTVQPAARVTLSVLRDSSLVNGYQVQVVVPGAVGQRPRLGAYQMTDLVVIVESKLRKIIADQEVADSRFAFQPPRSAKVIDRRTPD